MKNRTLLAALMLVLAAAAAAPKASAQSEADQEDPANREPIRPRRYRPSVETPPASPATTDSQPYDDWEDQEDPDNREPIHPRRNRPSVSAPSPNPVAAVYYDEQGQQRFLRADDLNKGEDFLRSIKVLLAGTEVRLKEKGCETECLASWASDNVERLKSVSASLHDKLEPLPPAGTENGSNPVEAAASAAGVACYNNAIQRKLDFLNSLEREQETILKALRPVPTRPGT
jgi:hypothetical protein